MDDMDDDVEELKDRIESLVTERDRADSRVRELEADLDHTRDELNETRDLLADTQAQRDEAEVELREAKLAAKSAVPAGDDELRGLASTIRTAQRTGHPDANKHLENLLRKLGA